MGSDGSLIPKDHAAPSVFRPENLPREARRQKNVPFGQVPEICVLDPDGDIVRACLAAGRAERDRFWACYHTEMYDVAHGGETFGIVGCAVGRPGLLAPAVRRYVRRQ